MSEGTLDRQVHALHNKVGGLNTQMQSLVGSKLTPDDPGRVGRLERATDALAISQGELEEELQTMSTAQKISNLKLAGLMSVLAALGSMAGAAVIKMLLG